ncbi:MAG TPA: hypothetical protein VMT76_18580 [Puia sp.]|nr:hypothetical protein [Puia sp.]
MFNDDFDFSSGRQQAARNILFWRIAQIALWIVGLIIFLCLLLKPSLGILLFWNILIPVAPALLVVAAGVWRNICPLATTNLLPRHLGLSKRKKLSASQAGKLNLTAVIILYMIVPLRHPLFNNSGAATALLIFSMVITGVGLGFIYDWKSAWCSGLCPIHPVEKLYGENALVTVPNAHCLACVNCVKPCPDSTPNIHPGASSKTIWHRISGLLIIGGLPGFIWGWFHVSDEARINSISSFFGVYEMPVAGAVITFIAYCILLFTLKPAFERKLIGFFAALAVSCYYWFRIPCLLGFGNFADDGLLIDLKGIIPEWAVFVMVSSTAIFFFYWLFIRNQNKKSWLIRPEFAESRVVKNRKLATGDFS